MICLRLDLNAARVAHGRMSLGSVFQSVGRVIEKKRYP